MEKLKVGDKLVKYYSSGVTGKMEISRIVIERVNSKYAHTANSGFLDLKPILKEDGSIRYRTHGSATADWEKITDENKAAKETQLEQTSIDTWLYSFIRRATIEQKKEIIERYGSKS